VFAQTSLLKKQLVKNEEAVSPVIGVMLMVAITVVIAAVVASFAYGLIGEEIKTPNTALVVDNAHVGSYNITVFHHGRDTIVDAFTTDAAGWRNLKVKYNGVDILWAGVTVEGNGDEHFTSGEQLEINFTTALVPGDAIAMVYIPTGGVLQRVKVK